MLGGSSTSPLRAPTAAIALLVVLYRCCCSWHGADALHFYINNGEERCFIQELPQDTSVAGDYWLEEWSEAQNAYVNGSTGVRVQIEELPDRHRILNQHGGNTGKVSFTASESGDHSICLSTNTSTWFSTTKARIHFSLSIGEHSKLDEDKDAMTELARLVRELNIRIVDIRREQGYQRETEAKFRDQSEHTNSKVLYWTFCQLLIVFAMCFWQMKHLKGFFEAKKLV